MKTWGKMVKNLKNVLNIRLLRCSRTKTKKISEEEKTKNLTLSSQSFNFLGIQEDSEIFDIFEENGRVSFFFIFRKNNFHRHDWKVQ